MSGSSTTTYDVVSEDHVGVFDHRPTMSLFCRSALAESDVYLLKRCRLKQGSTVVQPTSGSSTADLRCRIVRRSALAESDDCLLKRCRLKQGSAVVQPTSGSTTADLRCRIFRRSALAESDDCLLKRCRLKQASTVVQPTSGSSTDDVRCSFLVGRHSQSPTIACSSVVV